MEIWAVIYNPQAGGFREHRLESIAAVLRDEGVQVRLLPTGHPGHATQLAREVDGVQCVAVHGGDGTLNEAANGLLGRDIPLAFLPGGTANVVAVEQGLPMNPVKAAAALARGNVRPVLPGMLDGHCFLLMAGFGFDADAVHAVNPGLKARLGKGAYALSALRVIGRRQPGLRVTGGFGSAGIGRRRQLDAPAVPAASPVPADWAVVARSRHYGGRHVLHPGAGLEAPALGLVAVRPGGVLPFLIGRMALRLPFRGSLSMLAEGGCRIEADAPIHVQVDGDYFGQGTSFRVQLAEKPLLLRFPG